MSAPEIGPNLGDTVTPPRDTTVGAFIAQLQPRPWNDWPSVFGESAVTTKERLNRDFNKRANLKRFFRWPPDVFALTSSLLQTTGAYRIATLPHRDLSSDGRFWPVDWPEKCRRDAHEWIDWMCRLSRGETETDASHPLNGYIQKVTECLDLELSVLYDFVDFDCDENAQPKFRSARTLCENLLRLHSIADETMRGIGTLCAPQTSLRDRSLEAPQREWPPRGIERLHLHANFMLVLRGTLSRLDRHRGLVIPKTHASQVGDTLRSFSHHLTYHRSEVDVAWRAIPWVNFTEATLNALVVPWPFEIDARAFRSELPHKGFSQLGTSRFFSYESP